MWSVSVFKCGDSGFFHSYDVPSKWRMMWCLDCWSEERLIGYTLCFNTWNVVNTSLKLEIIAPDRDQTGRINLTHDLDLNQWLGLSIPWAPWSWPSHMQKFKVNGQSVLKIAWKHADGWPDGDDCVTSHANVVHNNNVDNYSKYLHFLVGMFEMFAVEAKGNVSREQI